MRTRQFYKQLSHPKPVQCDAGATHCHVWEPAGLTGLRTQWTGVGAQQEEQFCLHEMENMTIKEVEVSLSHVICLEASTAEAWPYHLGSNFLLLPAR